ncbi:MAG: ABC transporter substrate-binding protein, partial [Spirochaetales bacterium]|nr:ABC transporter substrate-binding protein [Candidatus Physcosoma equi]
MKKTLALAIVLLLALSVFAQGATEAKAEKQTLVLSTWGTAEDAVMQDVIEPFEKMYNCEVIVDWGTTADRYNKPINDPNTTVDVV